MGVVASTFFVIRVQGIESCFDFPDVIFTPHSRRSNFYFPKIVVIQIQVTFLPLKEGISGPSPSAMIASLMSANFLFLFPGIWRIFFVLSFRKAPSFFPTVLQQP